MSARERKTVRCKCGECVFKIDQPFCAKYWVWRKLHSTAFKFCPVCGDDLSKYDELISLGRAKLEKRPSRYHKNALKIALQALSLVVLTLMTPLPTYAEEKPDFNKVVDAIYRAEGGAKAKVPFGILSVKCDGYDDCRKVCYNTVKNNYDRWQKSDKSKTYLEFLRDRYCPVEAHPLNKNWLKNVKRFLNEK